MISSKCPLYFVNGSYLANYSVFVFHQSETGALILLLSNNIKGEQTLKDIGL